MLKLKNTLISLLVVILIVLLLVGISYAEEIKTGVINTDSVNMRETPQTTAKILMQLSRETKITIVEIQGDWYKISYNGSKGFVFGKYVTLKNILIESGTIKASNVNVRSKPGTDSEIITKLDKGAKLEIFEYSGNWARILIGENRYGWVHKDFITIKNLPVSRSETSEPEKADDEQAVQTVNVQTVQTDDKQTVQTDDKQTVQTYDKDLRQQMVEYAKKLLGVRYLYGGSSPKGFDCSGFVSYVFKHFDINLKRTSADQGTHGTKISRSDLKPCDLVFFDTNGGLNGISHVGIYMGEGKIIHATSGKGTRSVTISDMTKGFYNSCYLGSRRYIND